MTDRRLQKSVVSQIEMTNKRGKNKSERERERKKIGKPFENGVGPGKWRLPPHVGFQSFARDMTTATRLSAPLS
jgi:hypothetical protein